MTGGTGQYKYYIYIVGTGVWVGREGQVSGAEGTTSRRISFKTQLI